MHRLKDMADLKTFLTLGKLYSLTQTEIAEIKYKEIQKRQWQITRRRVVDEFTRERTGDPSMTAEGWKLAKMMKKSEFNWK
jgi:squalene cyclase